MDKNRQLFLAFAIGIPVVFILFILAIINVLLFLLGVMVLLGVALILKKKTNWFVFSKNTSEPISKSSKSTSSSMPTPKHVYMVLSSQEDFGARRIQINKTSYSIGRSINDDYIIEGKNVSRQHVFIEYDEEKNRCYVIDKKSTNGTYLNSVRMDIGKRYPLNQGDQLMIDGRLFTAEYANY